MLHHMMIRSSDSTVQANSYMCSILLFLLNFLLSFKAHCKHAKSALNFDNKMDSSLVHVVIKEVTVSVMFLQRGISERAPTYKMSQVYHSDRNRWVSRTCFLLYSFQLDFFFIQVYITNWWLFSVHEPVPFLAVDVQLDLIMQKGIKPREMKLIYISLGA